MSVALKAAAAARQARVPRVKIRRDVATGNTRPAITAMVVISGIEFLNTWLVDKRTLPERRYLTRLAVLGFMLALLTEVTPKLGRSMSYLIMTAVIFQRSGAILKALDTNTRKPAIEPDPGATLPGADSATYILYRTGGPAVMLPHVPARTQLRRPQAGVGTAGVGYTAVTPNPEGGSLNEIR